uniref:Nuclear receptor domain-containing protein n=1 Tax=Glossina brevipalpis TaxID=37001 RepID=A0A1A9W726_9MUSC
MSSLKTCAVCGDKALGYNFNAITCESCKAFFRRNALSKKQFNCLFNQNCEITVITRRFCQKCRLKKCLDIGMKSENIMSEEDKLVKRRKIETNRVKNKLNNKDNKIDKCSMNDLPEEATIVDSSGCDSYSQQSYGSFDSALRTLSPSASPRSCSCSAVSAKDQSILQPEYMTSKEIVDFILCDPDQTSQAISKLMRTPSEALSTLETIIDSQDDALRLVSHLINNPGDALKIITKITNSPINALSVFTKFMSSPTDALQIISKVISSPEAVLQCIKNLLDSPENAAYIMNKFTNSPAEALSLLNRLLKESSEELKDLHQKREELFEFQLDHQNVPKIVSSNTSAAENCKNLTCKEAYANGAAILRDVHIEQNNFGETLPFALDTMPALKCLSPADSSSNQRIVYNDAVNSEVDVAAAEFANEYFDIKTFAQNLLSDNSSFNLGDNLNSLETVLTEVIRIEYQAFNDLPSNIGMKKEKGHLIVNSNLSQIPRNVISSPIVLNKNNSTNQHDTKPLEGYPQMSSSHNLNEIEIMKLSELKTASEALYLPVDDDLNVLMSNDRIKPEDSQQDFKLLQVINLTAVAIKRLIKMAKKIAAFRDMCQEDQVALLKGGCTEMMIMRSVLTYDDDRNTWKIPHTKEDMSNIRAEVLKLAKGNVYEEHLKFISTFDEKWRMDENIILIMCAILLFTPTRPRVVHSDVIQLEQNSYYYLLRRYLESVYSGCEAKSAFIKLIEKISDVVRLNKFIIGVYLNVNPSLIEPLLREIFDLKNH